MVDVCLGLRVVRGPDWEWGDQDGGEGFVGTVAGLEEGGGGVIVQWDMGQRSSYRCGRDNKFDLRVLDSGPSGNLKEFPSVQCSWCQEEGLVGCVWRCTRCLDYYLCSQCYHNNRHCTRHPFFRLDSADYMKNRLRHCSRWDSRKVTVRGIFPESGVVRGTDWKWGDQDGGAGTKGKVVAIKEWQKATLRSVAEVQWGEELKRNVYRIGHKGKVDLKCIEPAAGGCCYLDHLPVVGGMYAVGAVSLQSLQLLAAGDVAKVELDIEILKLMQAEHGGWNDGMATVIGHAAMVNYVHFDGDPELRFSNNQIFKFNVDAVSRVEDREFYFIGDVVKVIEDMTRLHDLQIEGAGWLDELALTLGQVGVITKLTLMGHIQVRVNSRRWVYDPRCLIRASPDLLPVNHDNEDMDLNARAQFLTMMPTVDKLDIIVLAAAAGDTTTVRKYLHQHPEQVNRMVDGRAAIHEACKESYLLVLEILLEYNPDLEMMDSNGIRPVQSCAYGNSGESISLLLKHGADINNKGANDNTALMIAVALGHTQVLSVILAHPLLNIHAGGSFGDTALQCATVARRSNAVKLLLEAGADPSIADYTATTPFHQAVGMGKYQIVEMMLMYYPRLINLQKEDDGFSLFHMAAANKQSEILDMLLQQRSCNINIKTTADLTALHVAALEGYAAVVETLVGYGADLNATVEGGNAALHFILVRKNMKPIDQDAPYTLQVERRVKAAFGERNLTHYAIVVCMLVLEGADLYQKNTMGDSPMALCPPDITDILGSVIKKCGRGEYHGSLCKSSVPLPKLSKKVVTAAATGGSGGEKAFPSKELKKDSDHPQYAKNIAERSPMPKDYENKPSKKETPTNTQDMDSASKGASGDDNLCCLCDQEINVRLRPCGHTVMCFDCSHIARRCPICNAPIKNRDHIT